MNNIIAGIDIDMLRYKFKEDSRHMLCGLFRRLYWSMGKYWPENMGCELECYRLTSTLFVKECNK